MHVLAQHDVFSVPVPAAGAAYLSAVPARLPAPRGLLSGVPLRRALAANSGRVQWRVGTLTPLDILLCRFFLSRSVYTPNGALLVADEHEIPAARLYRDPVVAIDIDDYCAVYTLRVESTSEVRLTGAVWLWLDDGVQMMLQTSDKANLLPQQEAALSSGSIDEDPRAGEDPDDDDDWEGNA